LARLYSITTEAEEGITTAAETLLQLRATTTTIAQVVAWGVSFDGATSTDAPVQVRLLFQTTDGTASAATEVAIDARDDAAASTTGFHSFTAEPTAGGVIEHHQVHPQGGNLIREYPPGREPTLASATSSRIGIEVTAAVAVNAVAWVIWSE
jgi:hypothetical protein